MNREITDSNYHGYTIITLRTGNYIRDFLYQIEIMMCVMNSSFENMRNMIEVTFISGVYVSD